MYRRHVRFFSMIVLKDLIMDIPVDKISQYYNIP